MNQPTTKLSLSEAQRHLVGLMQWLNFGRIEDLTIQDGQPVFDGELSIVQKVKIGGENGPRPEFACEDFLLKKQTSDLVFAISAIRVGRIRAIEVRHGLPFAVEVELRAVMPGFPPGVHRG